MTEPDALEEAQAQADSADADFVTVPIGAIEIRVLPTRDWPASATKDLDSGLFEDWAEKCLVNDAVYETNDKGEDVLVSGSDDYEKILDADPTNGEFEDFFEAWGRATGVTREKLRASARSSRRTRRR